MLRKLSLALAVTLIAFTGRHIAEALPTGPSSSDSLIKRTYDLHDLINGSLLSDTPIPDLSPSRDDSADLTPPATTEQVEGDLINKIRNTVEMRTWSTVPPMKFEDDNLVVLQTVDVQEKIARFLTQLADHPHAAISVEAEYFDISRATHGDAPFLLAAKKQKSNSLSTDDANAMEEAARNDRGIKVSTATLQVENFHGGYSFTGQDLRYVSGYDRIANGTTTTYKQKIASREMGTLFSIRRAEVSADGQYVTLDLRFEQSHLREVKSQPFDQVPHLQIQVPMFDVAAAVSRITVPQDGYTMLASSNGGCFILIHARALPTK